MKTEVAIVGIGSMGYGILTLINRFENIEVVAISDINQKVLEKSRPLLSKYLRRIIQRILRVLV